MIPDLADFLLGLDSEQVAHLEAPLREGQPEDGEGRGERLRRGSHAPSRAKKYVGNIEEFVGPLTQSQRALVARHASNYDEATKLRLADRQHRQVETLRMIRNHVSARRHDRGARIAC